MALEPDILIARNPATGSALGRIEATRPADVAAIVTRAKEAQRAWGETPWPARREVVRNVWTTLSRQADEWADLLRQEIGKPLPEAMVEVVTSLDSIRWTVQHGARALADRRLGAGWQRWLLVAGARVRWRPLGVIGMIGTWNYPLLLNAPPIVQALLAGNAIVWKPSEQAPLAGQRLCECLRSAGVPDGLATAVFGGPSVGQALAAAPIDKGLFTGGIAGGRRGLVELAGRGIPAVAELAGFDPAIVLPDAPREPVCRALTWAAFVGGGQTCVAVKRVYIVGDAERWASAFAEQAQGLRVGDPADDVDIGPMISAAARERFHESIQRAIAAGAMLQSGGRPLTGPGWFYPPTVLLAHGPEPERVLEGVFGPVLIVRAVPTAEAAIQAANGSEFGLSASVWGLDTRQASRVADRLEAGMVAVNDAVAPSAHASAPFGGVKGSGFGRVRGELGLREFLRPTVLQARRPGGPRPQLFPYSNRLLRLLKLYRRLFHPRG